MNKGSYFSFLFFLLLVASQEALSKVPPPPKANPNPPPKVTPEAKIPADKVMFWSPEDEELFKKLNKEKNKKDPQAFEDLKKKRDAWLLAIDLLKEDRLKPQISFELNEKGLYTFRLPNSENLYEVNYETPDKSPQAIKLSKDSKDMFKLGEDNRHWFNRGKSVKQNKFEHNK